MLRVNASTTRRQNQEQGSAWNADTVDGAACISIDGVQSPFAYLQIPHVGYARGLESAVAGILIMRRDVVAETLSSLGRMVKVSSTQKSIYVVNGANISFSTATASWDLIVLDPVAKRLVQSDFTTLLQRRAWSEANGMPFRRGYLLYGPPGNGKTSVLRAMAAHPQISPATINFGDQSADDETLSSLFTWAHEHSPSLIFMEDLDRHFNARSSGGNRSSITLSHLLNCLDGVANPEGIIVVATANDPAALDSAILRRPGRFDRVVSSSPPHTSFEPSG